MTFFVDANVIVYSAVDGPGRESCLRVLEAVAAGEAEGRTSPAVLEEVWHVVLRRYPRQLAGLLESVVEIFSPLLPVTEAALVSALSMGDSSLDPNDRLHAGTCATHGIDVVLSANRAFDGIGGIERVDPLDPAAVERLLAARAT
jgi:predicted nucleic acid-binding protein